MILANIVSTQDMELSIKNTTVAGSCTFSQNMLLEIAAGSALSSSLQTLLSDSSLGTAIATLTHTYTEEQQKGGTNPVDIIAGANAGGSSGGVNIKMSLYATAGISFVIGVVLLKFKQYGTGAFFMLLGIAIAVLVYLYMPSE
jgi:hypothetical protein